jgi:superfamily I DNA/RNA helicase
MAVTKNASSWEGQDVVAAHAHSKPSTRVSRIIASPSPQQLEFLRWIEEGEGNAELIAVAGAGKTTTLLAAANALPADASAYAVVFNRKNADELRSRFPANVTCGTFHSVWSNVLRKHLGVPSLNLDTNKTRSIIERVLPHTVEEAIGRVRVHHTYFAYITPLQKLIGYAKNEGMGTMIAPNSADAYATLIDYHDIDLPDSVDVQELITYAAQALELSAHDTARVDFDDMLWLPLVLDLRAPARDFVFVDEAQDTNPVQRELVRRMGNDATRFVFVGDPHQAIYGFRGATSDAMKIIAEQFNTTTMPLTVSYRCPKAVVERARSYVSHITAHDSAPEGSVETLNALPVSYLKHGTAVLCRLTAPLVSLCYDLIARRIPSKILGRDLGAGLIALIRQQGKGCSTLTHLRARLEQYRAKEIEHWTTLQRPEKAVQVDDKVTSIFRVIEHVGAGASLDELVEEIAFLFSNEANDGKSGVVLATVHRSKGLEWPHVIIIRPDMLPLPWAKRDWQREQERNLAYVACTRSKLSLTYVEGERVALIA